MRTNNETGAVYDVKAVSDIVKRYSQRAIVHSDCVQAYMKEKLSLSALGADIISVSGHKVHALKGVGAIVVKKGLVLPPHTFGGGQERGLRSGTENTVGIASLGASVDELMKNDGTEKLRELYDYAKRRLSAYKLNIPENASPAILSVTLEGYRSEIILHALSKEGIFVSSGSACSSRSGKSGVLSAFGLSDKEADSTVRVSLSHYNTNADIDALADGIQEVLSKIKRSKR
jgi:cysteine desulfurase